MTMMIGDDRAVAHAVTDLFVTASQQNPEHKAERQVEPTRTAYIFGHYDSRGGGALVLAANHIEAMKKYMNAFFCFDMDNTTEDDDYKNAMIDAAQEDFLKKVQLVVCDEALPDDEVDLQLGFNDDGYVYARVDQRYEQVEYDHKRGDGGRPTKIHTGKFSEWVETDILVLWKLKKDQDVGEAFDDAEEGEITEAMNAPKLLLKGGVLDYEHKLTREDFGEDACGLCLIR